MGITDLVFMRLTGSLLITGAIVFWSVIVAAIIYWRRTGSFPFSDPSTAPVREFYESIGANTRWWRWVNGCFATGIVVTTFGLTALKLLLNSAGNNLFSEFGLVSFLIGTLLWLVLFTFNLSIAVWAAQQTASTGEVPTTLDAWPQWMDRLVSLYMVFAYLSVASYGAALLNTALLPSWVGWVSVIAGLVGAVSIVLGGSRFAIPLLIHIVPALIGVLLLKF